MSTIAENIAAIRARIDAAARQTEQALRELQLPCLDYFLVHCLPSFQKNLDELS